MHYGIAIWNYCHAISDLPAWIDRAADAGFDTISLLPYPFAGEGLKRLSSVAELLRERGILATVHGKVGMDMDLAARVADILGDRLYALTCDSLLREDGRGRLHDAPRIATALRRMQLDTEGTGTRLAVEDFPLDAATLEFFRAELGGVHDHPRTGILVDVGHLNLRRAQSDYFGGRSVADYFASLPVPLVEVHVHDNDGTKDQHGHLGYGSVPFGEVAAALRGMGFDGMCTIEIAPSFHGSTPEASWPKAAESLAVWREHMGG